MKRVFISALFLIFCLGCLPVSAGERSVTNIGKTGIVKVDFFAYASFRKRFMKVLLDLLENDIGKDKK